MDLKDIHDFVVILLLIKITSAVTMIMIMTVDTTMYWDVTKTIIFHLVLGICILIILSGIGQIIYDKI